MFDLMIVCEELTSLDLFQLFLLLFRAQLHLLHLQIYWYCQNSFGIPPITLHITTLDILKLLAFLSPGVCWTMSQDWQTCRPRPSPPSPGSEAISCLQLHFGQQVLCGSKISLFRLPKVTEKAKQCKQSHSPG